MIRVKISKLKSELSRFLKLVELGEEVEILDRKRPVARLVAISGKDRSAASPLLQRMESDELVQRGSGRKVPLLLTRPPGKGAGVLRAVLEEREGR